MAYDIDELSSGRLMRWRLRLSEFDFTVQYCLGIVHQVPDALSRVISPQGNDDRPVDEKYQRSEIMNTFW